MQPQVESEVRPGGLPLPALAAGDAAIFLIFTVIGLFSHGDTFTPYHLLRNIVPLEVSWFLVAVAVETYQRGGWARLGLNWLIGLSAAVIVRKWWVGSPNGTQFWTFAAVVLLTNGFGLLVWRLVAARLGRTASS